jgi:DNA-binding NtrC family response regulator
MKPRILVIGADTTLINSRASILNKSYETITAHPNATMEHLHAQHYDLLLVCHSMPYEEASSLIHQAHAEYPHLCIVRLLAPGAPPVSKPIAHAVVTVDYNPEVWLRVVEKLLAPDHKAAFS